jgi:GT2 family glycosyltransferase
MKFSIITASYNQGDYIKRCLRSVQQQSYRDFEHLVHDGVSTDGSEEILRAYAAEYSNVKLVIERDGGQVQAINNGFKRASGDILVWLNTDDFFFDNKTLATVSAAFDDGNVDVVYGKGWYVDEQGKRLRDVYVKRSIQTPADLLSSIGVFQPALFFRRDVYERVGGLNPRYQLTLDYEYWIRVLQMGYRFKFVDAFLAQATLHDESKTCGSRTAQLIETILLLKEEYGYVHPDWLDRLYNQVVAHRDWTTSAQQARHEIKEALSLELPSDHRLTDFVAELLPRLRNARHTTAAPAASDGHCRVVATSFDSKYFAQGLNLIASLHAFCRNSIDLIVVYDLGLLPTQIELLGRLEGVVVAHYPAEEPWPGYLQPKSYVYKCLAIHDARRFAGPKGTVLWIDAGVCVTGPMEEVFHHVEQIGHLLINHDDRQNHTLINAAFTHPRQVELMRLSFDELMADHVCSCVVGYAIGSHGDELVAEAYRLSLQADLNLHTKHPDPKWQQAMFFEAALVAVDEAVTDHAAFEKALAPLARFPYYGHRQDQSLYSNLAARMGLEIASAMKFCPATDYSSEVSFENWKSGGEHISINRTHSVPTDHAAPMFHHRGTFSNTSGLEFERAAFISREIAFILGNGPSLKDLPFTDLRNVATIGMNAAYRYWDEQGWYPSYYCCMDTVVIMSHAAEIYRLVQRAAQYGIRLFFLRKVILERFPDLESNGRVLFLEDVRPLTPLFQVEPITTGSYALMFMAFLGFRTLYLSGVDCNYVERVQGVADGDQKNKLVVVEDVRDNPNYFFGSYQRSGDEFNLPNPSKDLHIRSWRNCWTMLKSLSDRMGAVRVINLNQKSRVDCFENASPLDAVDAVAQRAAIVSRYLIRAFFHGAKAPGSVATELTTVLKRAVAGRFIESESKPSTPHYEERSLSTHRNEIGPRVEFRLAAPPRLESGDVVTAALVVEAPRLSAFKVSLLHVSAWSTTSKLSVQRLPDGSVSQSQNKGLYASPLDGERILVLLNVTATRTVSFEGIAIEAEDGGGAKAITVHFLERSHFRPAIKMGAPLPSTVSAEVNNCSESACSNGEAIPSFRAALQCFREGDYLQARRIAMELAASRPEFRWYRELANACEAKLA